MCLLSCCTGRSAPVYFFSEWEQIERRVHGDKDGSQDTL